MTQNERAESMAPVGMRAGWNGNGPGIGIEAHPSM